MQARPTNSFITSTRLISAQTLPCACWETSTHQPHRAYPASAMAMGLAHVGRIHRGQDSPGLRAHTGKLGAWSWDRRGHCGCWTQGTHWHALPIVTSSPVLATRQTGRKPGPAARCWHPTPLAPCPAGAGTGTCLASPWGCMGWEGECSGSVCLCSDAPGECWSSHRQLSSARQCCVPCLGVSQGQHRLVVARSQPLLAGWWSAQSLRQAL